MRDARFDKVTRPVGQATTGRHVNTGETLWLSPIH
jgi:hypothetical protein